MNPFYKKILISVLVVGAAAVIVLLGTTGRSIDLTESTSKDGGGSGVQPEVISGSNPNLFQDTFNASPSTNGVSVTESKVADAEKSFEQRNLTERISIDLFAKYLILKNNGQEVTPETQEALIKNVIDENIQKIEYTTYTGANLGLISAPSTEQLHAYGNAIVTLIRENSPKQLVENELTLLAKMAEKGSTSEDLALLKTIAEAYTAIGYKLVRMTIPSDAKTIHVSLANAAGRIGVNIAYFPTFESDPATAISHISAYDQNVLELSETLKSIAHYLTQRGITYSTNEPGYTFTLLGQ